MEIMSIQKSGRVNRVHMTVAAAALTALLMAGCAGSSSVQSSTSNLLSRHRERENSRILYTAIGASDAVGVGAVECPTAGIPPMPSPPSCPGGTGYVPDLANLLSGSDTHVPDLMSLSNSDTQVTLVDLGISGGVIGPDIQLDTIACFNAPGNFITNELPRVNESSNLVTIFAGGNDANAIVACAVGIFQHGGDPTAFIRAEIGKFGADYANLVEALKEDQRAREHGESVRHVALGGERQNGVTIIVANLPNFALIPRGRALPPSIQALLAEVTLALDQAIINPSAGTTVSAVVDTLCDPASYAIANFSADGFHPNAVGYELFAHDYFNQVLAVRAGSAPKPAASCPPFTLSVARRPITPSDAAVRLWRY